MRNFLMIFLFAGTLSACSGQPHTAIMANHRPKRIDISTVDTSKYEVATLAGGCFWKMDAAFQELNGVKGVASGYAGGTKPNPTYEEVGSRTTGYTESIQIAFDPKIVSYREILQAFWMMHDPTQLNREGNDVGNDYRSEIFYRTEAQKKTAEEVKAQLLKDGKWSKIVTTINPFTTFYRAEDYHQDYYNLHPDEGYTAGVVAPKVRHFEEAYKDKLRKN